ncbi:MAG: glycoside hydrolase family 99-like domain-containing protein [Chitinophagaceae bacterium]|nr:glycoside hydrolase family 99-like domain-containing protein [Chitinophagaceae bacterium]
MKYVCLSIIFSVLSCFELAAQEKINIKRNSFQSDQPIIRANRPFHFNVVIENPEKLKYECRLVLPDDVARRGKETVTPVRDAAQNHRWEVACLNPGQKDFTLEVLVGGKVFARSTINQVVMPARKVEKPAYIPAPSPAKTDILVGAHNCPLWETGRHELWNQVVHKHQERTPALGIYSQDNPEISDWETKWALEHGISFFIYCWYRTSQNGPITTQFEKSVFDEALFKSKYGDQMKFTIMWENQSKGTSGITDEKDLMENLMPYWIEKFFKRDNYLKIDNKPVLYVYRPLFISDDLGGDEKAKVALNLMREACKKAGFDGLIIMGEERGFNPTSLERFKAMGLDYTFQYCWHVTNSPSPEVAIESQMEQIRKMQSLHDVMPQVVTFTQAWSGWQDEGSVWKLAPKDFEILLRKGKAFIEKNFSKDELGSRMIILDNWNEWSEGHYLAPYREHGFGYLDAVRRVFSQDPEKHDDLIPEDIGKGPYNMPMELFEKKEKNKE